MWERERLTSLFILPGFSEQSVENSFTGTSVRGGGGEGKGGEGRASSYSF